MLDLKADLAYHCQKIEQANTDFDNLAEQRAILQEALDTNTR